MLFLGVLFIAAQVGSLIAKVQDDLTSPRTALAAQAVQSAPAGGSSGCGVRPGVTGSTLGVAPSAGGCGMSSTGAGAAGGCCGGVNTGGSTGTANLADAEKAAVTYYKSKGGTGEVTAKATDYGCHVGVEVLKNGAVVASYSYSNGQVY